MGKWQRKVGLHRRKCDESRSIQYVCISVLWNKAQNDWVLSRKLDFSSQFCEGGDLIHCSSKLNVKAIKEHVTGILLMHASGLGGTGIAPLTGMEVGKGPRNFRSHWQERVPCPQDAPSVESSAWLVGLISVLRLVLVDQTSAGQCSATRRYRGVFVFEGHLKNLVDKGGNGH